MPIYEYACAKCRTIFQFWSQTISESRTPSCPSCKNPNMQKLVSSFAIGRGQGKSSLDSEDTSDPLANMSEEQQSHVEKEMMKFMSQADDLDENDPKQIGAFMRRLSESTGLDLGQEMNEAIRRLESGEDPEKIEEEMGPLFDEEGGGMPGSSAGWSYDDQLYDL